MDKKPTIRFRDFYRGKFKEYKQKAARDWARKNRDKVNEQQRKRYWANPEKARAAIRERYALMQARRGKSLTWVKEDTTLST